MMKYIVEYLSDFIILHSNVIVYLPFVRPEIAKLPYEGKYKGRNIAMRQII